MTTILALSPHLDDGVLSVGASLLAAVDSGARVVVGTVFTADPPIPLSPAGRAFHRHCGLADAGAVAARRAEDRAATSLVRAEHVHLPLLDCLYRRLGDRWLYNRSGAPCAADWPPEPELSLAIEGHVGELVATVDPTVVWTCAAIGGHVDHRLVRDAARRVCEASGRTLLLWEDLPYAYDTVPPKAELADTLRITERHLRTKVEAVACYSSQVLGLWPDDPHWRDRMRAHAEDRRALLGTAEPLWRADVLAAAEPPAFSGIERS